MATKMGRYVDLSQAVTFSYYDEEREEWRSKKGTIEDLLDDLCDSYTITDAVPSNLTEDGVLVVTVDDLDPIMRVFLKQRGTGNFSLLIMGGVTPSPCDACKYWPPSSGDGKPCTVCPAEGR